MAVLFSFQSGTGKTLAITLERLSDGFEWRQASVAGWQAAGTSTFADRKIAMTEGTADKAGGYTASVSGLGNAANVRVRVHNDGDADQVMGMGELYVWGGEECPQADVRKWLGTTPPTPTVPGVPEVDIKYIEGDSDDASYLASMVHQYIIADEAYFQTLLTAVNNTATSSSVDDLPTNAELDAALGELVFDAPTVEEINDFLSDEHGAGSWLADGTAGPGASENTITISDGSGGFVADADVWISATDDFEDVIAGPKQSNSNGQVTFLLDVGVTYYIWAQKDGNNSAEGVPFVAT